MTERLADISARIERIRELGAVVNAMKGVAAARAHGAQAQLSAVDDYAGIITTAMTCLLGGGSPGEASGPGRRPGLLVFCAEQGFAGAFSERVLDSIDRMPPAEALFLIGTRGQSVAALRGVTAGWGAALPSHTPGLPRLADRITTEIYRALSEARIDCLDVVFTTWKGGRPAVVRERLFPIALTLAPGTSGHPPLTHLPDATLLAALGQEYFNAQVCKAALHAFAAENEARMQAMSSAGSQIARELDSLEATLRRVRQEAITAEIIELGSGAAAATG